MPFTCGPRSGPSGATAGSTARGLQILSPPSAGRRLWFRELKSPTPQSLPSAPASRILALPPFPGALSELSAPRQSVERLAVQRRGRRRASFSMLHQCPCGVPVRCNGLFDNGTLPQRFADPCQRIAGGFKTIASCEQTVLVFEPESLRLRSFRPGFRLLPPLHSSRDQISPRANRPRQKYPACRTLCR